MAPKRFKKSDTNEENGEKYKNLTLSDVLCPICRSILIEPVTLPCNHGFCLACFNGTMENTALTCPLCRIRIGSWLRSARKEKKIVNDVLWRMIQIKFSKEIRKKSDGDDITSEEKISIKLANPGEIRREYELQLEKERSEIQKQRDSEAKASELVIQKILEEEKSKAKFEKEKLRMDEELAKRLAAEQQKAGPSSQNQTTPKSSKKSSIDRYLISLNKKKQDTETKSKNETKNKILDNSPQKMIPTIDLTTPTKPLWRGATTVMCQKMEVKQQCSKAFQHLLLSKTLYCDRAESIGSDSGDSIKQEMRYFKPIRLAPTADYCSDLSSPLLKITPKIATSPSSAVIRSPHRNLLVRIGSHPGSAFVSCSPEQINKSPQIVQKPSIATESGKVLKQYYNRKRNTLHNRILKSCKMTSPVNAPCLGFEIQSEHKHVTIMRDLISTMSENLNRCLARNFDSTNVLKEVPRQNVPCIEIETHSNSKKKSLKKTNVSKNNVEISPKKRSTRKMNGCDVIPSTDADLQEKLDLEFAKRLHEELNNPRNRSTRASIQPKKPAVKTRSSPRKRQTTLDELVSPKKFKI